MNGNGDVGLGSIAGLALGILALILGVLATVLSAIGGLIGGAATR